MKRRNEFVLRASDGSILSVSEEIYRTYYRMRRNERYQEEKRQRYGVLSMDAKNFPKGMVTWVESAEDIVIRKTIREKCGQILQEEWEELSEWDKHMMRLLFFNGKTLKDTAMVLNCSRGKVINHRNKVIQQMRHRFEKEGIL